MLTALCSFRRACEHNNLHLHQNSYLKIDGIIENNYSVLTATLSKIADLKTKSIIFTVYIYIFYYEQPVLVKASLMLASVHCNFFLHDFIYLLNRDV